MQFTDSHCHLDFTEFDSTRSTLLSECYNHNIHQIIIPAIAPSNWQNVLELTHSSAQANQVNQSNQAKLFACLGIHPWFLQGLTDRDLAALDQAIAQNSQHIIAIGEAGIDLVIARSEDNLNQQIEFFHQQLQLANKYQLPIIIHHRRSHPEVLAQLKKVNVSKGGIIHAFSGSYQQALQYINLGFKLGIGGTITYPRATKTIKAIKRLPLSSLVLETDAPAMPLSGQQGKANSPLQLLNVFKTLCQIRDEPAEEIAQTIENNLSQLFDFS